MATQNCITNTQLFPHKREEIMHCTAIEKAGVQVQSPGLQGNRIDLAVSPSHSVIAKACIEHD